MDVHASPEPPRSDNGHRVIDCDVHPYVAGGVETIYPYLSAAWRKHFERKRWLLPLIWRMEKTWRGLRHEVPWVKKSPIEYVHDRMRFTTQPIDEPPNPRDLDKMIELMGYDNLCFSTDYPHWDNDMPGQTLRSLSADRRRKIFCDNALEALRM